MNESADPRLSDFFPLFPPTDWLRAYEIIAADQVPQPYHKLLVHEHHMTVTVEEHHGSLVDVRVLERVHEGDTYARKILLALQSTGRIVQFGLVRIHFQYCSVAVREEIVAAQTPLGRILIDHNVLRRIEPTAFLRILPGPAMMTWFDIKAHQPVYGRLALIHCDDQPAVELLEIVAP
ncbi:MAG: hypothetical protein L0Y71_12415 [Gemmataceae bacterium]|nr:hypothetical protein [Gemmataceae bacterium]